MLDTRIKKIWRDLSERKGRTCLTLLGMIIGLWGVNSVAVAWLVLNQDLAENFLSTNPPAIVMSLDGDGPLDMADLVNVEGVQELENRPVIATRMELNPDQFIPTILWVVEDFSSIRIAKFGVESGTFPPPQGSMVVERNSKLLANYLLAVPAIATRGNHDPATVRPPGERARIDDAPVRIKLPNGLEAMAQVTGSIHDPALPPSVQEQMLYAYVSRETADAWTDGGFRERLIVTPAVGYESDAALRQTAGRLKERLQALGYSAYDTAYPSTTRHVHQFQIDSVLYLLSGLGVLSLMMSTVLVLNLINGILTQQVRQIGIFRAIGASTGKVAAIYMVGMLLLGLLASLVAIPLAIKSGYAISYFLAAFMNFNLLTTELPLSFTAGLFALGLLFPVLAALAPILRWTRGSVTDALQYSGSNPNDETAARIDRLPLPLSLNVRMGIRNAFRKPQRLALTAATLGTGILIFMVALNMRSSLLYTASSEQDQKLYDVEVVFDGPTTPESVAFMGLFGLVERFETWKVQRVNVLAESGADGELQSLKIVPSSSEVMQPLVLAGNWLDEGRAGGVVINQRFQYLYPTLSTGSTLKLEIDGRLIELEITGVIKEFFGAAIYMRDADYRALIPRADNRVNSAYVSLRDPTEKNLGTLIHMLDSHFEAGGIGVRQVASAKIASRVITNHLDVIVVALLALALLMVFVGGLGMASGISASVVERTREIGILRAIGGKPAAIRTILSSEAVVMALVGWLLALLLSQPLSRMLTDYFGTTLVEYPFDYRGSPEGIAASLALTILLALLASLVPTRMVSRQPVKEAIAYE
jgi:putative ABC transport system permease protein